MTRDMTERGSRGARPTPPARSRRLLWIPGGLLVALLALVQLLLLHSYQGAARTTDDFRRTTVTSTAITNVQREALALNEAISDLRPGDPLAPIGLRRRQIDQQVARVGRVAGSAAIRARVSDIQADLARFDAGFAAEYGRGSTVPATAELGGGARLLDPVELDVKQTFDEEQQALDAALHTTLAERGRGQLLIAALSAFALLMAAGLAVFLRRAVRGDFARAYGLLERSEARFRRLVEQLPAVVYQLALSDDGPPVPVYVSPRAEALIGLDVDAPLTLYELGRHVPAEDRRTVAAAIAAARSGAPQPVEFRFQRSDGEEVWLRDSGAVVTDGPEGRQIQGLLFDVTAAKHAEAENHRMEAELRLGQKLEAVGQLAAGIAHEINTPIQFVGDTVRFLEQAFRDLLALQAIQDELELAAAAGAVSPALLERVATAREDADLDYLRERVPAAFERAADGIDRVATIVGAMREFAHPATAEQVPVDLNRALRNTLIVAANEYKYVADVETDLEELPPVVCNVGDVSQAFLNLIVNAAHAIADRVGDTSERGRIRIKTRHEADSVVVSIGDTGCGIPTDIAGRVFDPFFTTKAVGRGTGQGLAIARVLVVERHCGSIAFETVPGAGTTFHVRLPIAGRTPAVAPPERVAV
jgi:PAS domain S-box-containing protein